MSVTRTPRITPRSSAASHGRIRTENSALLALLRENSKGVAPDDRKASVNSRSVSVDFNAQSDGDAYVGHADTASLKSASKNKTEYIVVSKSRLSLNKDLADTASLNTFSADNASLNKDTIDTADTARLDKDAADIADTLSLNKDSTDTAVVHANSSSSKHSLEGSFAEASHRRNSRTLESQLGHHALQYNQTHAQSIIGTDHVHDINLETQSAKGERSSVSKNGGQSPAQSQGEGDTFQYAGESSLPQNSVTQSNLSQAGIESSKQLEEDVSVVPVSVSPLASAPLQYNLHANTHRPLLHDNLHENSPENTSLSFVSQHARESSRREPHSVNAIESSVPKLDFSDLSPTPRPRLSDADSQRSSSPEPFNPSLKTLEPNLHASADYNIGSNSIVHFSPGVSGRRTYEVQSPVVEGIPHVKSSDNFRRQEVNDPPDTFREREQGPGHVSPRASDLADDLKVPYPFDSAAQRNSPGFEKPPSPPVQTTPPPPAEPATSLRSNSNIYTVTNPEVQKAQSQLNGAPPSGSHLNYDQGAVNSSQARNSGSQHRDQVQFTAGTDLQRERENPDYHSPTRDRVPTPYRQESPPRETRRQLSPGEYKPASPTDWDTPREKKRQNNSGQRSSRKSEGLPPQHPPLDHQQSVTGQDGKRSDSGVIRRVYVESPSFTKEEEQEYRFVSSRLEDIEDRGGQLDTTRQVDKNMEGRGRGYGGDDNRAPPAGPYEPADRYSMKENREREYAYQAREKDYRQERRDERARNKPDDRNRFEDRSKGMNGYQEREMPNGGIDPDRFVDRFSYGGNDDQYDRDDQYRRSQEEEQYNERKGYRKQNTLLEQADLRREEEYQRELKRRFEESKKKINQIEIPNIPGRGGGGGGGGGRDEDNMYARDSLDFPPEGDRNNFARDSLEYDGYAQPSREWANPPQAPFGDHNRQQPQQPQGDDMPREQQMQQYYHQTGGGHDENVHPHPEYYDPSDTARMEVLHPKAPRYDYVEKNKEDYGVQPRKSYRDIIHKKKEEEQKLDHFFIAPKVPPKQAPIKKKPKKSQSAQPEHMGYQPQMPDPYAYQDFKPQSAEELWAQRAAVLARQKSAKTNSADSKKNKPSTLRKFGSDTRLRQPYQAQGQMQGQARQGYGTPTRLQPLDNKPPQPVQQSGDLVPTAVEPSSPFRRHMELKPITQEILTDDGQRISVDINLRLISPPPGHNASPTGPHGSSPQQHQLALVPVQETQQPRQDDGYQHRGVGVPYQLTDQYGMQYQDNGYSGGYQEEPAQYVQEGGTDPISLENKYRDGSPRLTQEEIEMADPSGYSRKYHPGTINFKDDDESANTAEKSEESYAALYHKQKAKDPEEEPWYKVYNISDYKKMQREVRLGRGTLGPDLDTEPYREKLEKRHKQFEYARMVMERNRMELGTKKPPNYPRKDKEKEEPGKRKLAIEYAKNVPKPQVKPRPNQYNSYEVAAQLAPVGNQHRRSPTHAKQSPNTQTIDVIDIRTLEQRHLQERKKADTIRQNMDSVLSQKA